MDQRGDKTSEDTVTGAWVDRVRTHTPLGLETSGGKLGLWNLRALLFIVIWLFFVGCGKDDSADDLLSMEARLENIEKKITRLEDSEQEITRVQGQIQSLRISVTELERSVARMAASKTIKKESDSARGRMYHVVRQGDTLSRIAKQYDLSLNELSRLNRITLQSVIRPGQRLLVNPAGRR